MSFSEHASLLTAKTTSVANEATERVLMTDLGTDIGAPFQLYIKNSGNLSNTGVLKYTDGTAGTVENATISADESQEIANNVHRILKYYLGSGYILSNISQVRLNVVFKS
jgi:hypothetical protein